MGDFKGLSRTELCRLCIKENGDYDLFNEPDLVKDIYLCTGVKLKKSNNLPRKVCKQCFKIIKDAKELRLMVQENERHMKILFDHGDALAQETNEMSNEKDNSTTMDNRSSSDDKTTDEEDNNIHRNKRCKLSSSENESSKSIRKREDLFTSSSAMNHLDKDYTYIEGTKYGITKMSKVDETNDVTVTYTCSMCPKTFTSWRKVYVHQRLHNKNHGCPKDGCKKKFALKGDLEKHIRTHTGERPFACDVCDKTFSQRVTLKKHKETVHNINSESLVLYVKD